MASSVPDSDLHAVHPTKMLAALESHATVVNTIYGTMLTKYARGFTTCSPVDSCENFEKCRRNYIG